MKGPLRDLLALSALLGFELGEVVREAPRLQMQKLLCQCMFGAH